METPIPVALIDDDRDLRRATAQTLELAGFSVSAYDGAKAALADLPADFAGPVVTDIRMPEIDGLQLFATLQGMDVDLPVILMTGHGDIPMAVQAIQDGAYDFIAKPFAADRLVQSVRRASEKRRLVLENRMLRKAAEDAQENLPLIGQTPVMENLRNILRHIADTDVDVLVAGETGSGKEVVAQLLHQWSHRRRGNFVALNCGALPETVIESELFGHEAGAFTGAQKRRTGRIEHASGGTLFLDEIESMPAATQVKMLRVLEMREITPLGTNEVSPVDLRVVAAAKIDLGDPAVRGDFREDLYYRLNVVTISIPPLRERRDDIPLLFSHFAARAAGASAAMPRRFHRMCGGISPRTHGRAMSANSRIMPNVWCLAWKVGQRQRSLRSRRMRRFPNGWNATRQRSFATRCRPMAATSAAPSRRSAFRERRFTTNSSATESIGAAIYRASNWR